MFLGRIEHRSQHDGRRSDGRQKRKYPMSNAYAPVRGKCTFWREAAHPDDEYDMRLKQPDKRVNCSCFVEGHVWTLKAADLPEDCPLYRSCRYYIRCY